MYGVVLGFYYYQSSYIIDEWLSGYNYHLEEKERIAGDYMSILSIVSAIFVPVVGFINDRYGWRIYLLFLSTVFTFLGYALLLRV